MSKFFTRQTSNSELTARFNREVECDYFVVALLQFGEVSKSFPHRHLIVTSACLNEVDAYKEVFRTLADLSGEDASFVMSQILTNNLVVKMQVTPKSEATKHSEGLLHSLTSFDFAFPERVGECTTERRVPNFMMREICDSAAEFCRLNLTLEKSVKWSHLSEKFREVDA